MICLGLFGTKIAADRHAGPGEARPIILLGTRQKDSDKKEVANRIHKKMDSILWPFFVSGFVAQVAQVPSYKATHLFAINSRAAFH